MLQRTAEGRRTGDTVRAGELRHPRALPAYSLPEPNELDVFRDAAPGVREIHAW